MLPSPEYIDRICYNFIFLDCKFLFGISSIFWMVAYGTKVLFECYTSVLESSWNTLPKTNIAPENRPSQRERIVFQPSIFRGQLLVLWIVSFLGGFLENSSDGCIDLQETLLSSRRRCSFSCWRPCRASSGDLVGTVGTVARSTHGKVNKKLVLTFIPFKELLGLFDIVCIFQ